ncbi:MAG: extracellular solute-binding protein [Clostridiales bacterium]|nr:extracellular solute-binding protein [Clostridiales bacterium]
MRIHKRLLSFTLAAILAFALTACQSQGSSAASGNNGGSQSGGNASGEAAPVTIKLWGAQEDQVMLQEMANGYMETAPNVKVELGVTSEADAATRFMEDPSAAADVFSFASDQIRVLVKAGGLYQVTRNKDAIIAANMPSAIEASTLDGNLYAYPMTADNGYFLYYDKSVLTDEDIQSLDGILAKCSATNKKFFMDVSNGFYIASFFLGAGLTLTVDENENQVCDWNNDTGVAVGESIKTLTADPSFLTGDDNVLKGNIGTTIAAGVSGIWNSTDIQEILGENFGAAKLPTFTVNGQQKQMGGFAGFKLVGVNSSTKAPLEAMGLAEYLTSEASQIKRYQDRQQGPANINAAASADVQANLPLKALGEQYAFASSQKDVLGSYWGPADAFGTALEAKDYSRGMKDSLDELVRQVTQPQ